MMLSKQIGIVILTAWPLWCGASDVLVTNHPSAVAALPANISITSAWVRALPPVAKVTSAYMEIVNLGAQSQQLQRVTSPQFDSAHLHRSRMANGLVKMEKVELYSLEPLQPLQLLPGGFHIMLVGPRRPLQLGQMIEIVMHWQSGAITRVMAPVKNAVAHASDR